MFSLLIFFFFLMLKKKILCDKSQAGGICGWQAFKQWKNILKSPIIDKFPTFSLCLSFRVFLYF